MVASVWAEIFLMFVSRLSLFIIYIGYLKCSRTNDLKVAGASSILNTVGLWRHPSCSWKRFFFVFYFLRFSGSLDATKASCCPLQVLNREHSVSWDSFSLHREISPCFSVASSHEAWFHHTPITHATFIAYACHSFSNNLPLSPMFRWDPSGVSMWDGASITSVSRRHHV